MTSLPTPLVPMATEGTGGTPGPCDVMAHVVAPRDVTAEAPVPMATEGVGGNPPGRVTSRPTWWCHVASLPTPLGDVSGTVHGAGGAVMVQFDPVAGRGGA